MEQRKCSVEDNKGEENAKWNSIGIYKDPVMVDAQFRYYEDRSNIQHFGTDGGQKSLEKR